MKSTVAHRLPAILLIAILAVVGICGLPPAMMFLVTGVAGGSAYVSLLLGAPSVVADAMGMWLWFRVLRPGSIARAWLLAVLGTVLVIGGSVLPVTIVGKAVHEEWQETQPGGRGYHPPTGAR